MNSKKLGEVRFQMKIVQRYRSAFERQIGESIHINSNLRRGVNLLNSKNEYNRCSIPRLGISNESQEELVERFEEEKEERELNERIAKLVSKLRMNKGEKQPAEKRRRLGKNVIETENETEDLSQKEAVNEIVSISNEVDKKTEMNKIRILKKIKERNEATKNLNYCDVKRMERKKEGWRKFRERWLTSDRERNSFWAAAIELLPVREQKLSPVRSKMFERVNTSQPSVIAAVVNSNTEAALKGSLTNNQGENEVKQLDQDKDITEKVANKNIDITDEITAGGIITDRAFTNEALTICSVSNISDKSKVITDSSTVKDLENIEFITDSGKGVGSETNWYPRRLKVPESLDKSATRDPEISATKVPEISATRVPEILRKQTDMYLIDKNSEAITVLSDLDHNGACSIGAQILRANSTSSARAQNVVDVLSTGDQPLQDPYLFSESGKDRIVAGHSNLPENIMQTGLVLSFDFESESNTDELIYN